MKNNAFNRNQLMMTTLDEMISEDSKKGRLGMYTLWYYYLESSLKGTF